MKVRKSKAPVKKIKALKLPKANPDGVLKPFLVVLSNICDDAGNKVLEGEKALLSRGMAEYYQALGYIKAPIKDFDDLDLEEENAKLKHKLSIVTGEADDPSVGDQDEGGPEPSLDTDAGELDGGDEPSEVSAPKNKRRSRQRGL